MGELELNQTLSTTSGTFTLTQMPSDPNPNDYELMQSGNSIIGDYQLVETGNAITGIYKLEATGANTPEPASIWLCAAVVVVAGIRVRWRIRSCRA